LDLYKALRLRVANREFSERKVPKEILLRILEAGNMAPSPENYQPWEFLLIEDADIRRKLTEIKVESRKRVLKEWNPGMTEDQLNAKVSRNKRAMETAARLVAVCYTNRDSRAELGEMRVSMSHAAAWCCIAYIWLAATAEGLGLSPTFYSYHVYDRVKTLLGLPQGKELAAVLRVGYPVRRPLGRKRSTLPLSTKLHENRF
jgi:5,6-dimethylbenzimidazole synthase